MGLALVILALLAVPISATDYKVGDASGWDLGVNYKSWLAGKTFLVGDRLVFTYGSTHTVDEVNQSGYTSCSASNAISTASDGNTTIHLTAVGTRYFLCGVPGHCQGGMKIQVTMAASAAGSPSGAPSIPTTPPQQSHGVSRISHSISSQALAASFIVTLALGFTC